MEVNLAHCLVQEVVETAPGEKRGHLLHTYQRQGFSQPLSGQNMIAILPKVVR